MFTPDLFLQYFIKINTVYFHLSSVDMYTKKEKDKYKLFFSKHILLDEVLIFFVLTKTNSVIKLSSIVVENHEWENNIDTKKYLTKTSYIDISKPDFLNINDVITYHSKDKFKAIAQLPTGKYNSLYEDLEKIRNLKLEAQRKQKTNIVCDIFETEKQNYYKPVIQQLGIS